MSQVVIFLSVYFAVYGMLHLYLMVKLRRAYYLHGLGYGFLLILLLFLMLAPIQTQVLHAQGMVLLATISDWIGFVWMGYLFIFVCIALPMDGYHLLLVLGQHLIGCDLTHLMLSRRQSVMVTGILALGLMVYGAYEARHPRVEKVAIESAKISASAGRIRIVQISDLHLGLMRYPGKLEAIAAATQAAQPDLLVSTGDLVNGPVQGRATAAAVLSSITAPLGKFAVTGEQEFYSKTKQGIDFTRAAGFTILRNRSLPAGKALTLVGIDDPAVGPTAVGPNESDLLARAPKSRFTLLLKHRPIVTRANQGRFDLQLSGHTHKGQIYPLALLVRLRYPMHHGLHRLPSGAHLYVSRGAGTWGPPIRLLAPPEITIIDLVPVHHPDTKSPAT